MALPVFAAENGALRIGGNAIWGELFDRADRRGSGLQPRSTRPEIQTMTTRVQADTVPPTVPGNRQRRKRHFDGRLPYLECLVRRRRRRRLRRLPERRPAHDRDHHFRRRWRACVQQDVLARRRRGRRCQQPGPRLRRSRRRRERATSPRRRCTSPLLRTARRSRHRHRHGQRDRHERYRRRAVPARRAALGAEDTTAPYSVAWDTTARRTAATRSRRSHATAPATSRRRRRSA